MLLTPHDLTVLLNKQHGNQYEAFVHWYAASQAFLCKRPVYLRLMSEGRPTFSADAAQVCDLHQSFGKHVRLAGPSFPHVDLQGLQQRLLQLVHLRRLLQVLTILKTQAVKQTSKSDLGLESDGSFSVLDLIKASFCV